MLLFKAKEYEIIKCIENPNFDFSTLNLDFSKKCDNVRFLNLHSNFKSDYFIGADWLKEKESAVLVFPKIEKLDYLSMFLKCMANPYTAKEITKKRNAEKIYDISFNKPLIKLNAVEFELTPLLIIHYLSILKSIIKKGLKKGYITETRNLKAKVKGKILINKTIKQNLIKGHFDKTFCTYQIFTIDNDENRILKKALIFVKKYLATNIINTDTNITALLNYCLSAFENVSNEIDYKKIKQLKISNFYREYKEGLYLAKMIMKRFSYSLNSVKNEIDTKIPPFYINMPLLFEIYALLKLKETFGNSIKYQYHGKYGDADFIDTKQKIIFDAKYKNAYINNKYDIADIRQLSGYARDKNVLKKLDIDFNNPEIVDCIIIYPDIENENDKIENLKGQPINEFIKFYKYGLKLPKKENNEPPTKNIMHAEDCAKKEVDSNK